MDYSYFNAATAQPPPYLFGLHNPHTSTPHSETFGSIPHSVDHFDYNYNFSPSFAPPVGVALSHSPPESFSRPSGNVGPDDASRHLSIDNGDDPTGERNTGRSSSEEKEAFTPAQNRRKAQNRAAQRAFRERKERHVRDLEQKLTELEEASTTLAIDNERLKRELAKMATENEILRATSSEGPSINGDEEAAAAPGPEPTVTASLKFQPTDLYKSVEGRLRERSFSPRVTDKETGERLLDAGSTWDLIHSHPLAKQGLVDLGDVCERVKIYARCDGQGPVFAESRIRKAIEESVAGGNDELI